MELAGDPIRGSKLFRQFCLVCRGAMRVTGPMRDRPDNVCSECRRCLGGITVHDFRRVSSGEDEQAKP
jgi:hypothetical protein